MKVAYSLIILFFSMYTVGCGSSTRYKAHKPVPDDKATIPQPAKNEINVIADGFDNQVLE